MKKINLISLPIIALALLSFTILKINTNPLFVEDYEDIGTIKQSLLKPELFNKTQKGVWVLLDGRELDQNTELYKILGEGFDLNILPEGKRLPDAKGKFIRCSNYLGVGSDPDAARLVGTLQYDSFQGHGHTPLSFQSINEPQGINGYKGGHWTHTDNMDAGTVDKGYGAPRISTETRPINLSMYTYVKVAK
ncbi:hypothetical protein [Flavobacterium luteolum]|uniref:hypothetical protein n=1 Tax=Flavobacterium luteolum TaxID=3003259 RepID=UPI00248F3208|nr:hypothetical protein [Flavobacterium luteolum]